MFENKWQSISLILGVVFLLLCIAFIIFVGFDYPVFLLGTFSGTSFFITYAVKQSREFQIANQLTSLLQRHQNILNICHQHVSPSMLSEPVSIEIARISKMTVLDEYLSVILDDNGQGYDFKLSGDADAIKLRLKELLTKEELQHITLS